MNILSKVAVSATKNVFHVFRLLVRKVSVKDLSQWLLPKSKSYFFLYNLDFPQKAEYGLSRFLFDTEHAVWSQRAIYLITTKFGGY